MSLDWGAFRALEGEPDRNFELLWRGVVQRHWERHGTLRSVRQQPGVEFHLQLERDCDLGEAGRWFGWQCRWYTLRQDNGFRADQADSIKSSIRRTVEYLPGVTDYVLCLRERPAADDVRWYFALDATEVGLPADSAFPRLHLWDQEDLEPRLSGDAAILRETYFGELVLTADQLKGSRDRSLAPVRERWMPEVNVATDVERSLDIALFRPGSLELLSSRVAHLVTLHADSDPGVSVLPADLAAGLARVRDGIESVATQLRAIVDAVDGGDPAAARELLQQSLRPTVSPRQVRDVARALRSRRETSALAVSATEEALRRALAQAFRVRELVTASCIAVIGDAGQGKSHIAAEVTAPADGRLAGVFIPGANLVRHATLDELVARTAGLRAERVDDLLEAVDAAGARAGQRIPIVIDGLNEAERPSEWHAQLANVEPALSRFPNLLLIVTLRGAVSEEVLIPEAHEVRLRWQQAEAWEAIHRYFAHFKIDPGPARIPFWLLRDPLFLRLFCEAVNGEREHTVGAESIPDDLVAVYELFREKMSRRIARDLGLRPELVPAKLAAVAIALWERRARDLPFEEVQEIVDESEWEWDRSLVRALAQEGILSRTAQESWDESSTSILFDRFAGFLIADSLLGARTPSDATALLGSTGLWSALEGDARRLHPLAGDILRALVGVVPRRLHGRQLWHFAPAEARDKVLQLTMDLSSTLIDRDTEEALLDFISERSPSPSSYVEHPFDQLWDFYISPRHRLNASFLDRVLRAMPIAARDSRWTEWVRIRAEEVGRDIEAATEQWSAGDVRHSRSDCAAVAFAWVTTTTNQRLRDEATLALQRYGRPEPRRIFDLATRMKDVDDPYVAERLLGACVGAALTHQMPDPGGGFRSALRDFLQNALSWYAVPEPLQPTSHVLVRDHVRTLFDFAAALHGDALPEDVTPETLTFATGPTPTAIEEESLEADELRQTVQMDFQNYTVGSLYDDRGNYNFEHAGWRAGLAEIRGRIWQLGWRAEPFGAIDERIASDDWRRGRADERPRTERYGKKYSRIAYYELAGRLSDAGQASQKGWHRLEVAHEFDPTFPADPPQLAAELPRWASQPPEDDRAWHVDGIVEVPEHLLHAERINDDEGPWVLVAGYLKHEDRELGREVWAFLRSMLVAAKEAESARALLDGSVYLGNHFIPDPPEDHVTYAGEMPWSKRFRLRGDLGWGDPPYMTRLGRFEDGPEFAAELVAHEYAAETGTIVLAAHGCDVPSALFARHFDLRQSPGRLDLVGLDGRPASKTMLAPEGFSGDLLYLREDLLSTYAAGRALVQVVWGERQVTIDWNHRPSWLADVAEHAELWRHIALRRYGNG